MTDPLLEQQRLVERDELRSILRELRGELAGIRTRLDSLVAIEKLLSYQGGRLTAIEKRLTTLVETRLNPETETQALLERAMAGLIEIDKGLGDIDRRVTSLATLIEMRVTPVSPTAFQSSPGPAG